MPRQPISARKILRSQRWIRSFGSMSGSPEACASCDWGERRGADDRAEKLQIGYWGHGTGPAAGGEPEDPDLHHQRRRRRNAHRSAPAQPGRPEDMTTIYGRLLWRVRQAKLTHGVRGILWHQGENDQGADGPTGGFGWETYRQYFIEMAAAMEAGLPEHPALLRVPDLAQVLRHGHQRLG